MTETCDVCGEEECAKVHTDTELHPDDAADGLSLHPFQRGPSIDENRAAVTTIAEASPGAAGLMVALMEHSRKETDWMMGQHIEYLEEQVERWKGRAHEAEIALARAQARVDNFLWGPVRPGDWDFPES